MYVCMYVCMLLGTSLYSPSSIESVELFMLSLATNKTLCVEQI